MSISLFVVYTRRGASSNIMKIFQWCAIALVGAFVTLFLPGGLREPVSATDSITFAFWLEPSEAVTWRWAERVYTEAFRRLGIEFNYAVYPPARASVMADEGKVDGEPARIGSYGSSHPNLVRVEVTVNNNQVLAYVKTPGMVLNGWDSLRGKDYRVVFYRGMDFAQKYLPAVVKPENLSAISREPQALKMLIAGRIDIYVDSHTRLAGLLSSPEFRDAGIYSAGVMMDISAYPYLHKRHAALAPQLAETLKQMKAEGLIQQYLEQAEQEFSKQ